MPPFGGGKESNMVTIKDVAKAAGVSVSTVSLVINDSELVKLETRYKVLQKIEELNYIPNQYARSLVTKRKNVIGLTWMTYNDSTDWFSFNGHADTYLTEMLPSIEKEVNLSNYSMLLEHYSINNNEKSLPSIMKDEKVDGMLIMGGIINDTVLARIKSSNMPTVLLGSRHDDFDYVDTDPTLGVYKATKYLLEQGHKDIVFINTVAYSQSSERKLVGFKKAMEENGVQIKEGWVGQSDYSGQGAYNVMKEMWESGIRPTAILGGYDCIALGALRFLSNEGLRCPEDISVIGYEDNILAEYSNPPLTTIRVFKRKLGLEACKVLFNRIKKPNAKNVKLIIEPELEIRGSVRNINEQK